MQLASGADGRAKHRAAVARTGRIELAVIVGETSGGITQSTMSLPQAMPLGRSSDVPTMGERPWYASSH